MPTADVRFHPGPLPDFCVIDGDRAAVQLLVHGCHREGWTTDVVHLEMLDRLFVSLWEESVPAERIER
ncbi:MAG: hypothetical protein GEU93_00335 [Propionibacteriales bacterium]|nr:hypothetical protein [Propionibacteriales bacterium]